MNGYIYSDNSKELTDTDKRDMYKFLVLEEIYPMSDELKKSKHDMDKYKKLKKIVLNSEKINKNDLPVRESDYSFSETIQIIGSRQVTKKTLFLSKEYSNKIVKSRYKSALKLTYTVMHSSIEKS